jgi:hypothetical protein
MISYNTFSLQNTAQDQKQDYHLLLREQRRLWRRGLKSPKINNPLNLMTKLV